MSLSILNVGAGDTKISFSKDNPAERDRACRIVTDMLKRGFAILVEVKVDGRTLYDRVKAFDPETCEYIVAGDPGADDTVEIAGEPGQAPDSLIKKRRGRPPSGKRVPAEGTRATGVARSAGGCARNTNYVRSR